MGIYKEILKRRTIRRFSQGKIPAKILRKIVNAGRFAPSAANFQPCEFIVVDKPELLGRVFSTLKWAGYLENGAPQEDEKPTVYIVVLLNKKKNPKGAHDVGAAMENMILTALEEGIGSCWLRTIDREKLAGILNVPLHCTIDSVLALGHPRGKSVVEEFKGSVKYWRDKEGVMHVPKRKLEEVLHINRYGKQKIG